MAKVTVQVATVQATAPVGVVPGALRFVITDTNGVVIQAQDVSAPSASFAGIADGTYVASVVRLDSNGNNLGDPVTAGFTVAMTPVVPDPVVYDAPSALTIHIDAE